MISNSLLAVGDSITHRGLFLHYLEVFHCIRFPQESPHIFNCGLAGGSLDGALKRFPWDISSRSADTATVMFGMNDLDRPLYEPGRSDPETLKKREMVLGKFEENLEQLVERLQSVAGRIVLLTPTIFDDTGTQEAPNCPGFNLALSRGGEVIHRLGGKLGLQVVDFHTPMSEINRRGQALRADFSIVGPDRIHPGAFGHMIMLHLLLKACCPSGDVARVTLRAPGAQTVESVNCTVGDYQKSGDGLVFSYRAEALPFPVADEALAALEWVPFHKEFNREILQMTGLEADALYELQIDGTPICTRDGGAWSRGVDLAEFPSTPQNLQARRVLELSRQRWELIWKLRDFVMVECQAVPDSRPGRPSPDEVCSLLEGRLESAKGQSYEEFFRSTGEDYRLNRLLESEWEQKAGELLSEILKTARPVSHGMRLTRTNDKRP